MSLEIRYSVTSFPFYRFLRGMNFKIENKIREKGSAFPKKLKIK